MSYKTEARHRQKNLPARRTPEGFSMMIRDADQIVTVDAEMISLIFLTASRAVLSSA